MLKITLLPPYVREKKRIRNAGLVMIFFVIVAIAAPLYMVNKLNTDTKKITDATALLQNDKNEVGRLNTEITNVTNANADLLKIVSFVDNVRTYNTELPKVLEQVAGWTYAKVQILEWQLGGTPPVFDRVTMDCRTDSVDSMYKALNNMWNAQNLFSQVSLVQVTPSISYPLGQAAMKQQSFSGGEMGGAES